VFLFEFVSFVLLFEREIKTLLVVVGLVLGSSVLLLLSFGRIVLCNVVQAWLFQFQICEIVLGQGLLIWFVQLDELLR